ncbi:MAG TPA: class I SAM-dependent methyltransferase [Firmicutes bacterium]|nr:class I SAM-dependent methyltransferase [Bacillota bacterium]
MTKAYTHLAPFYDFLMAADYPLWEQYLLSLFKKFAAVPKTILDLGCGTGNLTLPLVRRGFAVTGVDSSAEMLRQAALKAEEENLPVTLHKQDLRGLALPQVFDAAISTCDVLNYQVSAADLQAVFAGVFKHVACGGLFLFDLNSAYKLANIYGNQSYAELHDDFSYFWDNSYDEESKICKMEITFFTRAENGLYKRAVERHRQKVWLPAEIRKISETAGFKFLACYDFPSLEPYSQNSQRWQFVLQR